MQLGEEPAGRAHLVLPPGEQLPAEEDPGPDPDQFADDRPVGVLGDGLPPHGDRAGLTVGTAATPAGEQLGPVQGRHQPPRDLPGVERLVPLQPLVHLDQDRLQALRHEAGADVAEGILAEGRPRADRRGEGRLLQLRLELMDTREAVGEQPEDRPPDGAGGDAGEAAGVPHLGDQAGEAADRVEGPGGSR